MEKLKPKYKDLKADDKINKLILEIEKKRGILNPKQEDGFEMVLPKRKQRSSKKKIKIEIIEMEKKLKKLQENRDRQLLEMELNNMEKEHACMICRSHLGTCINVKCKHIFSCSNCIKSFKDRRCPYCRENLDAVNLIDIDPIYINEILDHNNNLNEKRDKYNKKMEEYRGMDIIDFLYNTLHDMKKIVDKSPRNIKNEDVNNLVKNMDFIWNKNTEKLFEINKILNFFEHYEKTYEENLEKIEFIYQKQGDILKLDKRRKKLRFQLSKLDVDIKDILPDMDENELKKIKKRGPRCGGCGGYHNAESSTSPTYLERLDSLDNV